MTLPIRNKIIEEIQSISPIDRFEKEQREDALQWVNSNVELFRIKKPNIPPKHLVTYFVLIDGDYILLVDHKKANLWLPSGGHVDPKEHPKDTVVREAYEELKIKANFQKDKPYLITVSNVIDKTITHTDVTLWYALKGDKNLTLDYDESEFSGIKWFHRKKIPFNRSDPNLKRFINKFYQTKKETQYNGIPR